MNIGLYIRLSKEDDNAQESQSIINQRMYLNNYIKRFNYQNVFEYIDDGYSGTNFNRPGFNQLIKDINNKKINTIITKDSSRLGRNISWVTFYIDEYFPSLNIRYISIDDNYDSINQDSVASDMLLFKSLFNDYYCKDISKKIKSSLKIKKIEGKYTGWKAPYGYKRRKDNYHKIEIDNDVVDNVKLIFSLAFKKNNPNQIAKILNKKNIPSPLKYIGLRNSKWSSKTIKDILTNEMYIGNLVQGKRKKINYKLKKVITTKKEDWIVIENNHEKIINKEMFYHIQEQLKKYKYNRNKIYNDELINIMYCKECGFKIGLNKKKNNLYCVCNNYKKNSKTKACTPHSFNYLKIKEMIIKSIKEDKKEIPSYIDTINKIYLSEEGTIDLFLNYSSPK